MISADESIYATALEITQPFQKASSHQFRFSISSGRLSYLRNEAPTSVASLSDFKIIMDIHSSCRTKKQRCYDSE